MERRKKKNKTQLKVVWLSVRWGRSECHTGVWGHGGCGFAVSVTSRIWAVWLAKCCCGVKCHSPECRDTVAVE